MKQTHRGRGPLLQRRCAAGPTWSARPASTGGRSALAARRTTAGSMPTPTVWSWRRRGFC